MIGPLVFGFLAIPLALPRCARQRLRAARQIPTIPRLADPTRPTEALSRALRRGFSCVRSGDKRTPVTPPTISDKPPSPKSP
jgi:hypothetical protein